jgi:gamma-glutamylcyclotransferase (GGCT)/AIG2-like uncharacterized protein YtfP
MLYFSYGANMNKTSMANRCPHAKDLGPALLHGYQLRFAHHADVIKSDTWHSIEGVLWEITDECLESLDRFEGYPSYYDRKTVTVHHHGERKQALVYFMAPGAIVEPPEQGYLDTILEGLDQHGISFYDTMEALKSAQEWVKHRSGTYYE